MKNILKLVRVGEFKIYSHMFNVHSMYHSLQIDFYKEFNAYIIFYYNIRFITALHLKSVILKKLLASVEALDQAPFYSYLQIMTRLSTPNCFVTANKFYSHHTYLQCELNSVSVPQYCFNETAQPKIKRFIVVDGKNCNFSKDLVNEFHKCRNAQS